METLLQWYSSGDTADLLRLCIIVGVDCADLEDYEINHHCISWFDDFAFGGDYLYDEPCLKLFHFICQY